MKNNKERTEKILRISRIIRAPPERVYKAFLDPDAMAKWLPPHGFTGRVLEIDPKIGGSYKMKFTNFSTGESHSFGGTYVELTPYKRIRYTDKFDDPTMPGEMAVTIDFKKTLAGTEVTITQKGIPDQIPLEFARMGWQESLQLLEQLVVPEIPSGTGPESD